MFYCLHTVNFQEKDIDPDDIDEEFDDMAFLSPKGMSPLPLA